MTTTQSQPTPAQPITDANGEQAALKKATEENPIVLGSLPAQVGFRLGYRAASARVITDAPGWRPIETAPQDGTPVLIRIDWATPFVELGWKRPGTEWRYQDGRDWVACSPTHWQPLPSPGLASAHAAQAGAHCFVNGDRFDFPTISPDKLLVVDVRAALDVDRKFYHIALEKQPLPPDLADGDSVPNGARLAVFPPCHGESRQPGAAATSAVEVADNDRSTMKALEMRRADDPVGLAILANARTAAVQEATARKDAALADLEAALIGRDEALALIADMAHFKALAPTYTDDGKPEPVREVAALVRRFVAQTAALEKAEGVLNDVLQETVNAPTYPDGPCLYKETREAVKDALAAIAAAKQEVGHG